MLPFARMKKSSDYRRNFYMFLSYSVTSRSMGRPREAAVAAAVIAAIGVAIHKRQGRM